MDFEKLKEMSESTYTETHKQLIQKIYGLSEFIENLQKEINFENNQNSYLVKKLETIMGGKINITKNSLNSDIGFQFQIQENQELLKLHTTSSSVNQLSTLYLYWKYWDANNFPNASLFIDEPEQNLHPENQVKITELLIQFANRNNNRVLICTHSPLIAEVINNYLVLGQLENREEAREKLGLAENCFLTPEDTGIYFFTGDTVREYKISDYGRFLKILRLRRRKCGILEWN